MYLCSPSIYLSMDLTIETWHNYNASQLSNSTAQGKQIGISHHHETCIRRFLLLHGWVGCKAACAEVSTGSVEASKAKHGQLGLQVPHGHAWLQVPRHPSRRFLRDESICHDECCSSRPYFASLCSLCSSKYTKQSIYDGNNVHRPQDVRNKITKGTIGI
jgi:hypothetical protein